MKFNKIKDLKTNKINKSTKSTESRPQSSKDDSTKPVDNSTNKIVKKKKKKLFYNQSKEQLKITTKVVMPKTKDDVSANWLQMHDLIKTENERKLTDNRKAIKPKSNSKKNKKTETNDQQTMDKVMARKEKFKLKRKLKRENAKLKKKSPNEVRRPKVQNKKVSEDKSSNNLWFDVDQIYLDRAVNPGQPAQPVKDGDLTKKNAPTGLTKCVGIDCEMVGVGPRKQSALARISIVNQFGHTIYDKYVLPEEKITDYRTFVSGIRPEDLVNGLHIDIARQEVEDIVRGKIVVGHAIHNDLVALGIKHPKTLIRDTSIYFKKMFNGKIPSLKRLSETLLNVKVQTSEHSSVEDAKATMRLYTLYKKDWETSIKASLKSSKNAGKSPKK